jgi:hypothetical protein
VEKYPGDDTLFPSLVWFQTETALIYDAVMLFAVALDSLDQSQVRAQIVERIRSKQLKARLGK